LIIETVQGVNNLEKILSQCPISGSLIVFGLFDYCLDAQIWPFWRHDSIPLWNLIEGLITVVESHHSPYIHTAFPELENDRLLSDIKSMLLYLCRLPCGMASLSQRQTVVLNETIPSKKLMLKPEECDHKQALELAHAVVDRFTRARCHDRSFNLSDHGRLFISPHEYLAAIAYLNQSTPHQ
jgi:hypothetical protein